MLANISQFEAIANSANPSGNVLANNARFEKTWDNKAFLEWLLLRYQTSVPADPRGHQSVDDLVESLQKDE